MNLDVAIMEADFANRTLVEIARDNELRIAALEELVELVLASATVETPPKVVALAEKLKGESK